MRTTTACGLLLLLCAGASAAEPFKPDPAGVRRYGPAYRYNQDGWTVLHIEGEPFERGYQHGRLMAGEIAGYVKALASQQSSKAPSDGWKLTRTLVNANFLRKFDREYLDEMRGIADGAAAAGATFDGRAIDLLDVATLNVSAEYDTLDDALNALPTGLEGTKFPKPAGPKCCAPPGKDKEHCSAFAATGPATADGKIVFGHITMWILNSSNFFNVWLDVKPAKGHRIVMQSYPGGIQSGMDYYINDTGLMVTETTINQTRFNPDGTPLASRIRKGLQYADSIDGLVQILTDKNSGLYANEWLIGDAKTDEIAILELGTGVHKLRRSGKKEWLLPGAEGFYWGCNNTKDLKVRIDTVATLTERPQDMSWKPSVRDTAWLKLYDQHRGKVDAEFGKLAFRTTPLAAHHSLDAKVTTTEMAKQLHSYALFGPPGGRVWDATAEQRAEFPEIKALVPNDWTVIAPAKPAEGEAPKAADIFEKLGDGPGDEAATPKTTAAWNGTLLPKEDDDLWVTAGFAEFEKVVALENALKERSEGKLSEADTARIELALFRYRTDFLSAKANRPEWRQPGAKEPASPLALELDRARWHREMVGYGVLTLNALRKYVGPEKFDTAMEAYGQANAGREIDAAHFLSNLGKATLKDTVGFMKHWKSEFKADGPTFHVTSWLDEPENAIIVYGTLGDAAANKEAAESLAEAVRVYWSNTEVDVVSDSDAGEEGMREKHVLLVGRPSTNSIAKRFEAAFPVKFGSGSVKVGEEVYAHEGSAVVAAGTNPLNPKFCTVLLAGLSADATYRIPDSLIKKGDLACEVLVLPNGGKAKHLVVTKSKSTPVSAPKE